MRAFFTTLFVIALVLAFGFLGFVRMLGGPHVFEPPITYAVTTSASFVVNGKTYAQSQGGTCSVHNQQGSIAVGSYSVDAQVDPLFAVTGRGGVIVSGLGPCHWYDAPPVAGGLYRAVPRIEMGDTTRKYGEAEIGVSGWVALVDDIEHPRLVTLVPLQNTFGDLVPGFRTDVLTLQRTDQPVALPIADAMPFVKRGTVRLPADTKPTVAENQRRRADAMLVDFSAQLVKDPGSCQGKPFSGGPGWVVIENACSFGRDLGAIRPVADRSLTRLDLDPNAIDRASADTLMASSAAMADRLGSFSKFDDYQWPVKICVGETCVTQLVGGAGYQYLTFRNQDEKRLVWVVIHSVWISNFLREGLY